MSDVRVDKRDYGIDILKLLSMFLVVVLHSYSRGIVPSHDPNGINDNVGFLVQSFAYCCVNCFALASGYVGSFNPKPKMRRIISLWLQVVFYTLLITLVTSEVYPDMLKENPVRVALTPVSHKTYWYFTAYIPVMFMMPVLNAGLNSLTKGQAYGLILGLIFLSVGVPYYSKTDLFTISEGYSFVWLLMLYLVGGALARIRGERHSNHKLTYLILYILCVIWAWGGKTYKEYMSEISGAFVADSSYLEYTSLPILLSSIFLLLFCTGIEVNNVRIKKVIKLLSSASFGVYLIHVHPYVFNMPFWGKFRALVSVPAGEMVLKALLGAFIIFVVCLLVDLIRIYLFHILYINELIDFVADRSSKIFVRLKDGRMKRNKN